MTDQLQLEVPDRDTLRTALLEVVTDPDVIGLRIRPDQFTDTRTLNSLGIDSAALSDSLIALGARYGLPSGDRMLYKAEFFALKTVGEVLDLLPVAMERYNREGAVQESEEPEAAA